MGFREQIILKMVDFEKGCPKRIQHFLKVYEFAHLIAEAEHMNEKDKELLEVAAIVHDIGIRPSKEKYGYCNGKTQEEEGPKHARQLFAKFEGLSDEFVDRICYLIAHHHTYDNDDGLIDYSYAEIFFKKATTIGNKCELYSVEDKKIHIPGTRPECF